jgi:hypothetical protein
MRPEVLSPQLRIALRTLGRPSRLRVLITVDRVGAFASADRVLEVTGVKLDQPRSVLGAKLTDDEINLLTDEPWCLEIAPARRMWFGRPDLLPESTDSRHQPECPDEAASQTSIIDLTDSTVRKAAEEVAERSVGGPFTTAADN